MAGAETKPDDLMEIDVAIPADQLQVGFDPDGLPRVEPTEAAKQAQPKGEKASETAVSADDLETARWEAKRAQQERDRLAAERDALAKAREADRAELDTRTGQAIRAHMHAVASEHQQMVNAMAAVKVEGDAAKRDLQLALAAEDMDAAEKARRIADANERIALAATDLRTLEQGKSAAEQRLQEAQRAVESMMQAPPAREEQTKQPAQQQSQQQITPEQWIGQFPPVTQNWLNAHKEFVTDPKMHRKLLRFADDWVDDHGNDKLHTSGFIAALNERFFPDASEGDETEEVDVTEPAVKPQAAPKKKAAPAAPVSRQATVTSSKQERILAGKVDLSPAQRQMAMAMYPNKTPAEALKQYALNIQRLAKEGINLDAPLQ